MAFFLRIIIIEPRAIPYNGFLIAKKAYNLQTSLFKRTSQIWLRLGLFLNLYCSKGKNISKKRASDAVTV